MQKIQVNTSEVMKTANDIEQYNRKIESEFSKIEHSINTLSRSCNSPSTNKGINCFKKIKKDYCNPSKNSRYEVINNYVTSLKKIVSEEYKEVEKTNKKIADEYK